MEQVIELKHGVDFEQLLFIATVDHKKSLLDFDVLSEKLLI